MKPLNPIVKEILEQRAALRPPPVVPPPPGSYNLPSKPFIRRLTKPNAPIFNDPNLTVRSVKTISPTSPSVEIAPSFEAQMSNMPVTTGIPRPSSATPEEMYVFPEDEYEAAINSVIATETTDPGFVSTDDIEKVSEYFRIKVSDVIDNKNITDGGEVFKELMKDPFLKQKIIGSRSTTLGDTLFNTIQDTIQAKSGLTVDPKTPSELQPQKETKGDGITPVAPLTVNTKTPTEVPTESQLQPEAEAETALSTIIATSIMPALVPMAAAALQPSPQRSKIVPSKKTATDTEEPGRDGEEDSPTYSEMARRKEYEEAITKPFSFEDEYPGLELEKTLGKYGGSFVKR
jgi:hypothetical protein